MKINSWSLLMLALSITMVSLAGCGEEPKVKSMTDGVEMSEIEAYEEAVRAMEAEDASAMDNINANATPPAE